MISNNQSNINEKYYFDTNSTPLENSYIKGKGYINNNIKLTKEKILKNCFNIIGISLLFMLIYAIIAPYTLDYLKIFRKDNSLMYLDKITIDIKKSFVISLIYTIKYLIPIILLMYSIKLPFKKLKFKKIDNANVLMISVLILTLLFIIFKITYILLFHESTAFKLCNYSIDKNALVILYINELIICPILIEILFRGIIFNVSKQFGLAFAILSTSILTCVFVHDISIWISFTIYNIIITYAYYKTDSLFSAILLKTYIALLNGLFASLLNDICFKNKILLLIASSFILIAYLINLYKGNRLPKFEFNKTPILKHKFTILLTRIPFIMCIIVIIITNISSIRFI